MKKIFERRINGHRNRGRSRKTYIETMIKKC